MTNVNRRSFCGLLSAAAIQGFAAPLLAQPSSGTGAYEMVAAQDRSRILRLADRWLSAKPDPITAHPTPREPVQNVHDFYTEAEFYWPVPDKPRAPYRLLDGKPNPDSFVDHRVALSKFSEAVSALTAAYVLTRKPTYAHAANTHLRAWFVADGTKMNSNPEFAGVIRNSGSYPKSVGAMDLLPLVEVARSVSCLRSTMQPQMLTAVQTWFKELLEWLHSSDNGVTERDAASVHSLGWALQAAEYARLVNNQGMRDMIRERFRNVQLPALMATDGSLPKQIVRANSYAESVLAFDLAATLAWELSQSFDPEGDYPDFSPRSQHQSPEALAEAQHPGALLRFASANGQSICKAAAFLYPYLKDKNLWPRTHDTEFWEIQPVRSPGLLFSGLSCESAEYIALWKAALADPVPGDNSHRLPLRQPILWV